MNRVSPGFSTHMVVKECVDVCGQCGLCFYQTTCRLKTSETGNVVYYTDGFKIGAVMARHEDHAERTDFGNVVKIMAFPADHCPEIAASECDDFDFAAKFVSGQKAYLMWAKY